MEKHIKIRCPSPDFRAGKKFVVLAFEFDIGFRSIYLVKPLISFTKTKTQTKTKTKKLKTKTNSTLASDLFTLCRAFA